MCQRMKQLSSRMVTGILTAVLAVFCFALPGNADERTRIPLDDATQRQMSTFISNFTEVGMFEISHSHQMKYGDYVYFGVMHNYLNNPRLIRDAGGGKVAAQYRPTFEAAKKYFGVDTDTGELRLSAQYKGMAFTCTNNTFIFTRPEPRTLWHASVNEAYWEEDLILMKGTLYNKANPAEKRGKFWAYAQEGEPGTGRWNLISLHEGGHDGAAFGSDLSGPEEEDEPQETTGYTRPQGAQPETIRVGNAEEFIEALGSNRVLLLSRDNEFVLTEAYGRAKLPAGVHWQKTEDGPQLTLRGVRNLVIRGEKPEGDNFGAMISATPRHAAVMRFEQSGNIAIERLWIGHTGSVECPGSALSFANCQNITLKKIDIAGSEYISLKLDNSQNVRVLGCVITDSTSHAASVRNSSNILFENTNFDRIVEDSATIDIQNSQRVFFDHCTFTGNRGQAFGVKNSQNIVVRGWTVQDCDYRSLDPSDTVIFEQGD